MTKIFVTYAKKLMFLKTDYNYKLIKWWWTKGKRHTEKWAQSIESMFIKESMQMVN